MAESKIKDTSIKGGTLGTTVTIDSYSVDNQYTCPSNGYVRVTNANEEIWMAQQSGGGIILLKGNGQQVGGVRFKGFKGLHK